MTDADIVREALDAYRKQAFEYGWSLTEHLQDRADAALSRLTGALERLSKIDPLYEGDLPFIDASRELQTRIEFAAAALAGGNR